ncbi:MAG: hypothetical protein HOO96_14630 [Polyangiaceae bacterium]|nr:hypothetical protein [Polyangiaceae bacterium]
MRRCRRLVALRAPAKAPRTPARQRSPASRPGCGPALLDLAKSPKVRDYRFGDGDYLRMVLALTPGAGAPRPWQGGTLQPAFPNLVALGSAEEVKAPRSFVVVTIVMQGKLMPADGGMELELYLDARTLETVLVMRLLGG